MVSVPERTKILVIGGGPAGSYAASALAREGIEVTLLEQAHFPRYHIGESMIPSCRPFLKFIDVEEKVKNRGFVVKKGAALKLNQFKREGYTDFISHNPDNAAWNVVRSEFDEVLLRHAAASGANVIEGIRVESLDFAPPPDDITEATAVLPVAAQWIRSVDGSRGRIAFDWLIDASGRNGILSTRYLKNRTFNSALRNTAHWGYWTGTRKYAPGTKRENAPWFEALTDQSGWAWFIPLHNGTTSVGVVVAEDVTREAKAKMRVVRPEIDIASMQREFYASQLERAPGLKELLVGANLKDNGRDTVRTAGDYSYSASVYAGVNWRLVGDAGAFIDPFFSSGIHLALTGGLSAAGTIASVMRGRCTSHQAMKFHDTKIATSYTRFLLVVLATYKQIRSQDSPVLSSVDEDNFDRAIEFLRPVIQGAEADHRLNQDDLNSAMDFCETAFAPMADSFQDADAPLMRVHDMSAQLKHANVEPHDARGAYHTFAANASERSANTEDVQAHIAALRLHAQKAVFAMYSSDGYDQYFASEVLEGFYLKMERGSLCMMQAAADL
ncbi:hypothetical protein BD626DRAFT_555916 [Schizophyllum amplum]|uniref:Halogenase n=1 Tax=Schizophyllum amplum TaxID=97359 RepID=A0A550CM63_9AGAR|nr:hypothetical protein BD626DRAFT_555916 [Auriculariopsis ampla]